MGGQAQAADLHRWLWSPQHGTGVESCKPLKGLLTAVAFYGTAWIGGDQSTAQ